MNTTDDNAEDQTDAESYTWDVNYTRCQIARTTRTIERLHQVIADEQAKDRDADETLIDRAYGMIQLERDMIGNYEKEIEIYTRMQALAEADEGIPASSPAA